jgi:hypothetical protein
VSKERSAERIPIASAAMQLGISYSVCRDRILAGRIVGGQDPDLGRWFVTRAGLDAALREKRKGAERAEAVPA